MTRTELNTKYQAQKGNAKRRDIEWQLTYQQWLEWWGADLYLRGPGSTQLVMSRKGDCGPYAIGNIRKTTARENSQEYHRIKQDNQDLEGFWNEDHVK